jgi:restriction system protein
MTPKDYEHHCAALLRAAGWQARVVGQSGDQGADIIAKRPGQSLVVQCKLLTAPAGNAAVQQVWSAQRYYGAPHGAVVSDSGFTPAARALARSTGVHLCHTGALLILLGPPKAAPHPTHSVQFCPCDKLLIRLPKGRIGTVRCPDCARRFHAVG